MKDITDSRRADQHIKNARKAEMVGSEEEEAQKDGKDTKTLPIHATIISRLFWPSMPSTSLAMPPKFRKYVSCFVLMLPLASCSHPPSASVRVEIQVSGRVREALQRLQA